MLRRQSVDLARTLAKLGREGRTIAIKLRLDNFDTLTRAHTIDSPTNDADVIALQAVELLRANTPSVRCG